MNTLMAGAGRARSARGRYTSAGYSGRSDESTMYIADVPAGSAQDGLRDYNRPGYRSERPWNETPDPLFEQEGMLSGAPVRKAVRKRQVQRSFFDRVVLQAKKERGAVAVCVLCVTIIAMLGIDGARKTLDGANYAQQINAYQAQTIAFERENERLEQQLEIARSGERIRNEAQNKLNMLRPERAQTETIYIQAMDLNAKQTLQQNEEPRMELLDILLGLLNLLPMIGE